MTNLNNALTIFSLIFTVVSLASMLIGGIYHLARIEANINSKISSVKNDTLKSIDGLRDNLVDRFYRTETKLEVIEVRREEQSKHHSHLISELDKKITHQGNRIKDWIEQIAEFLREKSDAGFHIRDRKL